MTTEMGAERFSARDAIVGYLFQVRLALLWALRKAATNSDFSVALETLDDVVFESEGEPTELLQAKHHISRAASLTDSSPDIWKTFRIWLTAHKAKQTNVQTLLVLVTTSHCGSGSAASMLKTDMPRDEKSALRLLKSTAQTSRSNSNAEAYALFMALSDAEQLSFLSQVAIIDSSPSAVSLEESIKYELRHWVTKAVAAYAISMLEGWWFSRVVRQLTRDGVAGFVSGIEFDAKIDDIREQFNSNNLPIDAELLALQLDEAAVSAYSDCDFVRQVRLVTANHTRLRCAVADYFRAYTQRSAWLRKDLLQIGELERYESELFEAWELQFARMEDDLEPKSASETMIKAGSKMLGWAESDANITVRAGIKTQWVCRGTLHQMADCRKIGWHPQFKTLLDVGDSSDDGSLK